MTEPSSSTTISSSVRRLLSAAVVGLAVSGACLAQAPTTIPPPVGAVATPPPVGAVTTPPPVGTVDPVDAFSDPGWTGRPQPPALLRKEAAAALDEGRRRCSRERSVQARRDCMEIVTADHRQMLRRIVSPRR